MLTPRQPIANSPAKLFFIISAGHVIPHLIIISLEPERSIIYNLVGEDINTLLVKFSIYYSFGIIFLYSGINIGLKVKFQNKKKPSSNIFEKKYLILSFLLFITYVATLFLLFNKIGGISHYFNNFAAAREDLNFDNFAYSLVKTPAAYLAIFFFLLKHAKTGKPSLYSFYAFLFLIVLLESMLGGRRTPIQFILFSLVALSIVKNDYKLVSAKNIPLIGLAIFIFVSLLYLRVFFSAGEGVENATNNGDLDLTQYILNFSYNDIYLFVIYHFSSHDLWYGSVFLDILYKIFPFFSPVTPPPSLDEGVYIYNLYNGFNVYPPVSLENMLHNSWPPRTFGNGYMNFGLLGVLIFFWIHGFTIGTAYKFSKSRLFSPISLFLYLIMVFSFQVANLKIAELIIIGSGLILMYIPIYTLNRIKFK